MTVIRPREYTPETKEEGIDNLKALQESALGVFDDIYERTRQLCRIRFEQGRITDYLFEEGLNYRQIEGLTGIPLTTISRARTLFNWPRLEKSREKLEHEMDTVGEKISVMRLINRARKSLKGQTDEEAEIRHEEEGQRLEKRSKALEEDSERYLREVEEHNNDELVGRAVRAKQVAVETQQIVQSSMLEHPERIRDPHYLAFIRTCCCRISDSDPEHGYPIHPHHIEAGGHNTKCPDHFTIPVRADIHRKIEDAGMTADEISKRWNFNVWKEVAKYMSAYIQALHNEQGENLPEADPVGTSRANLDPQQTAS